MNQRAVRRRISVVLLLLAVLVTGPAPRAIGDDGCPPVDNGDLVKSSGPEIYLYQDASLRWIPDLETFSALGYDMGAVDLLPEGCLAALVLGQPLPSVRPPGAATPPAPGQAVWPPGSQPGPDIKQIATPTRPPGPRVSSVATDTNLTLRASAVDAPVGSRVTLMAQIAWAESGTFSLTIQRTRGPAGGPGAGLLATCQGRSVCTAEVDERRPGTATYLATFYRCNGAGACVAERISDPVSVTWR